MRLTLFNRGQYCGCIRKESGFKRSRNHYHVIYGILPALWLQVCLAAVGNWILRHSRPPPSPSYGQHDTRETALSWIGTRRQEGGPTWPHSILASVFPGSGVTCGQWSICPLKSVCGSETLSSRSGSGYLETSGSNPTAYRLENPLRNGGRDAQDVLLDWLWCLWFLWRHLYMSWL